MVETQCYYGYYYFANNAVQCHYSLFCIVIRSCVNLFKNNFKQSQYETFPWKRCEALSKWNKDPSADSRANHSFYPKVIRVRSHRPSKQSLYIWTKVWRIPKGFWNPNTKVAGNWHLFAETCAVSDGCRKLEPKNWGTRTFFDGREWLPQ